MGKLISSPISKRIRASKLEQDSNRRASRARFREATKISNTKFATMLPYDSNSTSNYSRFAVDTRSHVKLEPTEQDIIDSVLNPVHIHRNKSDIRRLDDTCIAPEVNNYWRNRVAQSEQRRGKLYKKLTE